MSTESISSGALFISKEVLSTEFTGAVLKIAAAVGTTAHRSIFTLNPVTETSLEAESAMLKTSLITMVVR